ncbi:AMP-binding protein, partial [Pantoea sp. Tr-811]|uniref:condensation domain-containing protein n=1 Tax=Pantoea sp. Tr-811 TaxID=2608361 RepID=UPI0014227436
VTPNGKLDRKALPQPDASALQGEYVAPQSELEQQIAAIWADVLKLEQVGLTDNFFELGGDSIISLQVVSRARQADIHFTPKELFLNQNVRALAMIARRSSSRVFDQGPVTGNTPMLPIQHWFFKAGIPAAHHWNQSVLLIPALTLSVERVKAAVLAIVEHHDALRLRFSGEATFGAVQPDDLVWFEHCADDHALKQVAEKAQRSLNLQVGPLLRAVLIERADGSQRLLLVIHHLVVDGVSWRVLLEDLQQAYQSLHAGQAVKFPAKTSSFKDWAVQLEAFAQSPVLQDELAYWQQQLQGTSDALPCDYPHGSNQQRNVTSFTTRLDREITRQLLQEAPAAYRTQINDLLLTALARVIARWSKREEVLVRLEGHGREDLFDGIDLSRTVGWLTSMYPVKLSPKADLADSIRNIKEQLRAVPNKGLGYGLLRYLGPTEANVALASLPQGEIVFNYLGQFDGSFDEQAGLFRPAQEYAGATQDALAPLGSLLALNGQVYGGELKMSWNFSREVFDESSIEQLAHEYASELQALIEHCCQAQYQGVTPSDFPLSGLSQAQLDSLPVSVAGIADIYPLAPMQQGMLFHSLYEQAAQSYIMQLRVDVQGLDVERFQHAWQAALDAHPILRTGFAWQGELQYPVQVVQRSVALPFAHHDWRGQPDLQQALQTLADHERLQGFDLASAPLLRLILVQTDADRHHLVCTHHHILMDGWSTSRLLGEVLQRYAGVSLPDHGPNYRDFIAWLQRQDSQAAQAFWIGQLAALDEPTRLVQAIRCSESCNEEGLGDYRQAFDPERTAQIEAFARAHRVTVNTLMQSAWLLLLQRYTGQPSVCFGATVAGRPADLPGVEEQIGLFINTLPVIGTPRSEQRVADWIGQVQASNLALREFEHTPLYDIQRWAGQGGGALFDSLMVFENYPVSEALEKGAPGGLRFGEVYHSEQTSVPLTLMVNLGSSLSIHYGHDRAQWAYEAVTQLAEHFANLLQAMIQNADAPLGDLPLLSASEHEYMVREWNDTHAAYPDARSIHSLIEAQVSATPDAPALAFGEHTLSYAELNRRANQLAHKLGELGVGPDALVGIAMERSLEMVIGLLGIVKAGGAYVPLDPEYPQ